MEFCECGEEATTTISGVLYCPECAGDFCTGKSKDWLKRAEQCAKEDSTCGP